MMNADLYPHVWAFRLWAAVLPLFIGWDPFNPYLEAVEPQ